MYYRFGYYFNEDKANTRWYRFVKMNKKQGALTIYNNMLSSGGFHGIDLQERNEKGSENISL